jgi:accessory gene regulator B
MLDKEIIQFDDWEIYMYGLQLLISTVFKLTGFMLIASILGWVAEALIFLTVFSMLRVNAGGIHAQSYLLCFVATGTMMTAAILLSKVLLNYSVLILPAALTIAVTLIIIFAPVDSPNRRLNEQERKLNRTRSLVVVFSLTAIVLVTYFIYPQVLVFCYIAALAMLFESITLTPIFAH